MSKPLRTLNSTQSNRPVVPPIHGIPTTKTAAAPPSSKPGAATVAPSVGLSSPPTSPKGRMGGSLTTTKVIIRVRPAPAGCTTPPIVPQTISIVSPTILSIQKWDPTGAPTTDVRWYSFDSCLGRVSTDEDVCASVRGHVTDVLNGYNSTIVMYGQTSTGKTHTMKAMLPMIVQSFFEKKTKEEVITACFIEVYNAQAKDLWLSTVPAGKVPAAAAPPPKPLKIQLQNSSDGEKACLIPGLTVYEFDTAEALLAMVAKADAKRSVKVTALNDASSRSHSVLLIQARRLFKLPSAAQGKNPIKHPQPTPTVRAAKPATAAAHRLYVAKPHLEIEIVSALTMVDLAGCEDLRYSKAAGATKEEATFINASLSTLRLCIERLSSKRTLNPPFRDSVLTKLLVNSIGGNCWTTIIATVSDLGETYLGTLNTLRFVNIARRVRSVVKQKTSPMDDALSRFQRMVTDKKLSILERADVQSAIDELKGELARRKALEKQSRERDAADAATRQASLATAAVIRAKASQILQPLQSLHDETNAKEKLLTDTKQRLILTKALAPTEGRKKEMMELEAHIESLDADLALLRHKSSESKEMLQKFIEEGVRALSDDEVKEAARLAQNGTDLEDWDDGGGNLEMVVGDAHPVINEEGDDEVDDEEQDGSEAKKAEEANGQRQAAAAALGHLLCEEYDMVCEVMAGKLCDLYAKGMQSVHSAFLTDLGKAHMQFLSELPFTADVTCELLAHHHEAGEALLDEQARFLSSIKPQYLEDHWLSQRAAIETGLFQEHAVLMASFFDMQQRLEAQRVYRTAHSCLVLQRWYRSWPLLQEALSVTFTHRTAVDFTVLLQQKSLALKEIITLNVLDEDKTVIDRQEVIKSGIVVLETKHVVSQLQPHTSYKFYVAVKGPIRGTAMRTFKVETLYEVPTIQELCVSKDLMLKVALDFPGKLQYLVLTKTEAENVTPEVIRKLADPAAVFNLQPGQHTLSLSHVCMYQPLFLCVTCWDPDFVRNSGAVCTPLPVDMLVSAPLVTYHDEDDTITVEVILHQASTLFYDTGKDGPSFLSSVRDHHTITVTQTYPGTRLELMLWLEGMQPDAGYKLELLVPSVEAKISLRDIRGSQALIESSLDGPLMHYSKGSVEAKERGSSIIQLRRKTPQWVDVKEQPYFASSGIVIFGFSDKMYAFDTATRQTIVSATNVLVSDIEAHCVTLKEARATYSYVLAMITQEKTSPENFLQAAVTMDDWKVSNLKDDAVYFLHIAYPWETTPSMLEIRTLPELQLSIASIKVSDETATIALEGNDDHRHALAYALTNEKGEIAQEGQILHMPHSLELTGLKELSSYTLEIRALAKDGSRGSLHLTKAFKTISCIPKLTDFTVTNRTSSSLQITFESTCGGRVYSMVDITGGGGLKRFRQDAVTTKILSAGKVSIQFEGLHATTDYNIYVMPVSENSPSMWSGKVQVMQGVLTKGNEVTFLRKDITDVEAESFCLTVQTSGAANVIFGVSTDAAPCRAARLRSAMRGFKSKGFVACGSIVTSMEQDTTFRIVGLALDTQYYVHALADALVAPELSPTVECVVIPAHTRKEDIRLDGISYNAELGVLSLHANAQGEGVLYEAGKLVQRFPIQMGTVEVPLDLPRDGPLSAVPTFKLVFEGDGWSKEMTFDIAYALHAPTVTIEDVIVRDLAMDVLLKSSGAGIAVISLLTATDTDGVEVSPATVRKFAHTFSTLAEGTNRVALNFLRPSTNYIVLVHQGSLVAGSVWLDESVPTLTRTVQTKSVFPSLVELEISSSENDPTVLEAYVSLTEKGFLQWEVTEDPLHQPWGMEGGTAIAKGKEAVQDGDPPTAKFVIPNLSVGPKYYFQCVFTSECGDLVSDVVKRSNITLPPARALISGLALERVQTTSCTVRYDCEYAGRLHVAVCKVEKGAKPPTPKDCRRATRAGYGTPYFFVSHDPCEVPGGFLEISCLRPDESYVVYIARDALTNNNISHNVMSMTIRTPPKAVFINEVVITAAHTSATVAVHLTGLARLMWTAEPHGLYEYMSSSSMAASARSTTTEPGTQLTLNIDSLHPECSYDLFLVPVTKEFTHLGTPQKVVVKTIGIIPKLSQIALTTYADRVGFSFQSNAVGCVAISVTEYKKETNVVNNTPHRPIAFSELSASAIIRKVEVVSGPREIDVSDLLPSAVYIFHCFVSSSERIDPASIAVHSVWIRTPSRLPNVIMTPKDSDCTHATISIEADSAGRLFWACHPSSANNVEYNPGLLRSLCSGSTPHPTLGRIHAGTVDLLVGQVETVTLLDLKPGTLYYIHWAVQDSNESLAKTCGQSCKVKTPLPPPHVEEITLKHEGTHHVVLEWIAAENGIMNIMLVPSSDKSTNLGDSIMSFQLVQNCERLSNPMCPAARMFRIPFQAGSVVAVLDMLQADTDYDLYLCVCRSHRAGIGSAVGPLDVTTSPISSAAPRPMWTAVHRAIPEAEWQRFDKSQHLITVDCIITSTGSKVLGLVDLPRSVFGILSQSVVSQLGIEEALAHNGSLVSPASLVVVTHDPSVKGVLQIAIPDLLESTSLTFTKNSEMQKLLQALLLARSTLMYSPLLSPPMEPPRIARRKTSLVSDNLLRVHPNPTSRQTVQFFGTMKSLSTLEDDAVLVGLYGEAASDGHHADQLKLRATCVSRSEFLHVYVRNDMSKDVSHVVTDEEGGSIGLRLFNSTLSFVVSDDSTSFKYGAEYTFLMGVAAYRPFEQGDMSVVQSGDVLCVAVDKWALMTSVDDHSGCFILDFILPQLYPQLKCDISFSFFELALTFGTFEKKVRLEIDVPCYAEAKVFSGWGMKSQHQDSSGTTLLRWNGANLMPPALAIYIAHANWLKHNYATVTAASEDGTILGTAHVPLSNSVDTVPLVGMRGAPTALGSLCFAMAIGFASRPPGTFQETEGGMKVPPEVLLMSVPGVWEVDPDSQVRKRTWKMVI